VNAQNRHTVNTNTFSVQKYLTTYSTSSAEIRDAIQEVLSDEQLQTHMGRMARGFAVEHFSIKKVLELELGMLSLLKGTSEDE
jgi:glycosyltransferase involved in cell wall biosynthesis